MKRYRSGRPEKAIWCEGERGNVLFLILVAVALFGALSFTMSQSMRTQPTGQEEGVAVDAGGMNQYPTSVGVAVMKMTMSGKDVGALEFNSPGDFALLSSTDVGVFHPQGGYATYQWAPQDIMASGSAGIWHFNMEFEVENIGSDAAGNINGNDLIAFLPGIRQEICNRVNVEGDVGATPDTTADLSARYVLDMTDAYAAPADEIVLGIAGGNGTNNLSGKSFGCFRNNGGEYVYYHVLLEK